MMRHCAFVTSIVLAFVLVLTCVQESRAALGDPPHPFGYGIGDTLIPFTANDQNDNPFDMSNLIGSGTSLVLDFSQVWCVPCFFAAEEVDTVYDTINNDLGIDFEYITLLNGNEFAQPTDLADAQQWASDYGVSRPVLHTSGSDLSPIYRLQYDFQLQGWPAFVVVDGNGIIRDFILGYSDSDALIASVVEANNTPAPDGLGVAPVSGEPPSIVDGPHYTFTTGSEPASLHFEASASVSGSSGANPRGYASTAYHTNFELSGQFQMTAAYIDSASADTFEAYREDITSTFDFSDYIALDFDEVIRLEVALDLSPLGDLAEDEVPLFFDDLILYELGEIWLYGRESGMRFEGFIEPVFDDVNDVIVYEFTIRDVLDNGILLDGLLADGDEIVEINIINSFGPATPLFIPEPGMMLLMGVGLMGVLRRKVR